jgi:excisionase family DNA binding protein
MLQPNQTADSPANGSTSDRAITPSALARRFGCSVHTVLAWIAAGELRALNVAVRPDGKRWRITPEALEAFTAARAAKPTSRRRRRRKARAGKTYF